VRESVANMHERVTGLR